MNPLPFVHFFCLVLYVYLAVFVLARNPKAPINRVAAAILICFALWSLGGVFSHSFTTSKATVMFTENISAPGWAAFASFYLWGAFLFTKKEKILKSRFFYPALFLPPLLFIYKQWTNHMVVDVIKTHYGWGIVWSSSIWPYLYYAYVNFLLAASMFLVFRYWLKSDSPVTKKEAKILFFTTLTTLSLGFFTDVILPKLQIYVFPDIADIFAIITAAGLTYIVVKYKFLTITPATAAENIIDTMSDSLILLDPTGNIVKMNQATLDLLGYQDNELKGKPVGVLIEDKHEKRKNALFEEVLKGKDMIDYELTFKSKQGKRIPIIFSSSAIKGESGTLIGMICISRDISEWKRMEQELKDSEEKFKMLFEFAPDGYYLSDLKGRFIDGNRAAESLIAYKKEELIGKSFLKLKILPAKQIPKAAALLAKNTLDQSTGPDEFTLNRKDGTQIDVEISTFPIKIKNKSVVLGLARDITRRKQAEKELNAYKEHLEELVGERTDKLKEINKQLQYEKEKYQTLTENINVGIYRHMAGEDGTFFEVNPAIIKMFSYDHKEDFLATRISRHYHNPEDKKRFNRKMAKYGFVKNEELQLKRKDGIVFMGAISAVAVKDSRGNVIYYDGIIEDITLRKRLEEQLMQSQKIEAVNRLTGGIAHEFNNMLTSIIGYAELSQMDLGPDNPVDEYLDGILRTSEHAKNFISQLMDFSRKAMIEPKIINLNSILTDFQTLIQKVIGENILWDFIPGENLGNVEVDPRQIEQIIINLAANSRDAMPSGGRLTIMTENKEVDETLINQYPYMKKGSYVLLTVSDTGCGMNSEELSHIFEPFFSSKKSGGVGLGLSAVYGIVKQSNGFINIDSTPNRGTMVTVYLPRVDKPVETIEKKRETVQLPSGKETILVVEDEEKVRKIVVKVLSNCGYNILTARDGEEAFALWQENKHRVDLLLTDIVLPGISGLQLSQKLLTSKPNLKVIYMSGYSDEVLSQYGNLDKEVSFIQKPFTSAKLAGKIRDVLD